MQKGQSHAKKTIEKIRTSMLVNRLENHIFEEDGVVMDATQIRAAEILLKKTLPDMKQTELTGEEGGPLNINITNKDNAL